MLAAGPILKLFLERSVCAPQYLSAGTCTSPIVSFSILKSDMLNVLSVRIGRKFTCRFAASKLGLKYGYF